MSIIKNWEPATNSLQWQKVVEDAEGPNCAMEAGRKFELRRNLTPTELGPIHDMEQALACNIEYDKQSITVDHPLNRIIHIYLNTLK